MRFFGSFAVVAVLLLPAAYGREPARSRNGMAVSRQHLATDVGAAVLKSGGNAVDAAVAVGFALAACYPSAGNLGGGGFLLLRLADGRTTFLDFREHAPAKASRDMYIGPDGKATRDSVLGYRASGVPGTAAGLEYAHKKFGTKKWRDLVQPAYEIARKGFELTYAETMAYRSKSTSEKLSQFPASKRIFLKNGEFHEPGDKLVQPELAATLKRIRDKGAKDFYEGETARLLAEDMAAHGGLITREDLAAYKVVERRPLEGNYRGYRVITAPPPSSGGAGILQMLGILEGTDYYKAGAGSASASHVLIEAMRRYFADRATHLGDPTGMTVPVESLYRKAYVDQLRASINFEKATPSAEWRAASEKYLKESTETTHFAVADKMGNVAALTTTLNGNFGSGVTAEKLGFLLNNEMDDFSVRPGQPNMFGLIQGEANAIAPGKTPLSAMTPTIVLKDGKFYFTTGSPGGPTIINTVLQTLVYVIDFKMSLQAAVDFPRLHHQWMPDRVLLEPGFSPDTIALLRARGHNVTDPGVNAGTGDTSIGSVSAILYENGWFQGAPDPRTESTAKGY